MTVTHQIGLRDELLKSESITIAASNTMESDEKWLKWVKSQFKEVAGEDQIISPEEFKRTPKSERGEMENVAFSNYRIVSIRNTVNECVVTN